MISIDIGSHRFQLRAAAIVRRGEDVLLHRAERDPFWALPGGRVEPGEAAAEAVVREMREELGIEATCGELLFVAENFFDHGGRAYHEVGLCFETRLAPGAALLEARGPVLGREGEATLIFEWFGPARLCAADVRPAFLARALADPARSLRHVVQRDRATIAP
jgi:ADP-ribose pyrophosphatase YjhB (NUDIX family)